MVVEALDEMILDLGEELIATKETAGSDSREAKAVYSVLKVIKAAKSKVVEILETYETDV